MSDARHNARHSDATSTADLVRELRVYHHYSAATRLEELAAQLEGLASAAARLRSLR